MSIPVPSVLKPEEILQRTATVLEVSRGAVWPVSALPGSTAGSRSDVASHHSMSLAWALRVEEICTPTYLGAQALGVAAHTMACVREQTGPVASPSGSPPEADRKKSDSKKQVLEAALLHLLMLLMCLVSDPKCL